jgi:hypothetical protein
MAQKLFHSYTPQVCFPAYEGLSVKLPAGSKLIFYIFDVAYLIAELCGGRQAL